SSPLTYESEEPLEAMSVVTVDLRNRAVTGFVLQEVDKPDFGTKAIRAVLSQNRLPAHCLELAQWLQDYYACNLSEALRQFAPSRPTLRRGKAENDAAISDPSLQLELTSALTKS